MAEAIRVRRFRELFGGMLGILFAAIFLNIFLPAWFVKIVIGLIAAFFIIGWTTEKVNLDTLWARRIRTLGIAIFLVFISKPHVEGMTPGWIKSALAHRATHTSLVVADKIDSKRAIDLDMALYQAKLSIINVGRKADYDSLRAITEKVSQGELTEKERIKADSLIATIEKNRAKINAQLASLSLAGAGSKRAIIGQLSEEIGGIPAESHEYIAPVGTWSEEVRIPPNCWFRISPEDNIKVKTWNGEVRNLSPDINRWDGDYIEHAVFSFMAATDHEVRVLVLTRPKTS